MKYATLLVSGGAGNGVNALIASTVKALEDAGYMTRGIKNGFEGLLQPKPDSISLNNHRIDITESGSAIGYSREPIIIPDSKPKHYNPPKILIKDNEKRANTLVERLDELDSGLLIVICGDGTMRSLQQLFTIKPQLEQRVIAAINTMDNDANSGTVTSSGIIIPLNAGYPSAAYKLAQYDRKQAKEFSSTIIIHETLGRDYGGATAATALGNAEVLILPEIIFNRDVYERFTEIVNKKYHQNGEKLSIGVSEGARFSKDIVENELKDMNYAFRFEDDETYRVTLNAPNTGRKLGGAGYVIQNILTKKLPNIRSSVVTSLYIPRQKDDITELGAIPYDLRLNLLTGERIADCAAKGIFGVVPTLQMVVPYDNLSSASFKQDNKRITEINQMGIPKEFIDETNLTVKEGFIKFLQEITSGPKGLSDAERTNLNRTLRL